MNTLERLSGKLIRCFTVCFDAPQNDEPTPGPSLTQARRPQSTLLIFRCLIIRKLFQLLQQNRNLLVPLSLFR